MISLTRFYDLVCIFKTKQKTKAGYHGPRRIKSKPGLIKPRYSRTARKPRESRVGEEEKYIKTEEREKKKRI